MLLSMHQDMSWLQWNSLPWNGQVRFTWNSIIVNLNLTSNTFHNINYNYDDLILVMTNFCLLFSLQTTINHDLRRQFKDFDFCDLNLVHSYSINFVHNHNIRRTACTLVKTSSFAFNLFSFFFSFVSNLVFH